MVPRILIVCEGERTEPNYFRAFRVARSVRSVVIRGLGYNTLSLIEETIAIRDAEGPFDQVWCVLDTDSFPPENVRRAIARAKASGIRVACSNEAFELWYFLHFAYLDSGISRQDYVDKLHALLGYRYQKNDVAIYDALLSKQSTAIRNAVRLLKCYRRYDAASDKPSTTVHQLVEELNQHLE